MGLRKRDAVIAVTTALAIVFTGCSLSGGSQQKVEQQTRNDVEATVIHDTLAKVPGVVKVQVAYSNYITNPGSAHVNLAVEHGKDLEQVADVAVKEVWRSQLDPLDSIRVGVVSDSRDDNPGIVRDYNIFDHQAELEAKYGSRPAVPR